MNETQKNSPKAKAIGLTRLWQEHGPNTYPLNINDLIEGIIGSSDFNDELVIDINGFDSFEGALVRTNNTRKWTILLNSKIKNKRRQRFTFAHELGHFMCHRELQDKFEDSVDSLNDYQNQIETEANEFASWLLMPANLLRTEFSERVWKSDTLCEIGNRFQCSLQASALRFVNVCDKPVAFVVSRDGMILWSCKSQSAPFLSNYCFGDELPKQSRAQFSFINNDFCTEQHPAGDAWSERMDAKESQYFDGSGQGYQYTCLQFEA